MKADLATSIAAIIAGVVIAFFVTNFLTPEIQDVNFKVLNSTYDASLTSPSNELFNYRAVNPTVEVYVGDCTKYDEEGKCVDDDYNSKEESVTPSDGGKDGDTY